MFEKIKGFLWGCKKVSEQINGSLKGVLERKKERKKDRVSDFLLLDAFADTSMSGFNVGY